MRKADLRLDFVSHKAAKYAVERWHYSKRMPSGKLVSIGAWERNQFIGVVLFGRGASNSLGSIVNLGSYEVCELVRVALRDHGSPVSRVVAVALRLLKRTSPGIRAVLSFADPREGHHGGIYQAMGWVYNGTTKPEPTYFFKGEWVHNRKLKPTIFGRPNNGGARRLYVAGELPKRMLPGKHRYILALDPTLRDRVKALAKPYPKRQDTQASESSTCHPHGSGRSSTDPDAPGTTDALPELVVAAVRKALTDDLRRPKYRGKANPMAGHCYVASEALYHLLGGKGGAWKPMRVQHEGDSHWFLRRSDGTVLDITASQFKTPVPVAKARGAGFLTREPSKRAQVVMRRARATLEGSKCLTSSC